MEKVAYKWIFQLFFFARYWSYNLIQCVSGYNIQCNSNYQCDPLISELRCINETCQCNNSYATFKLNIFCFCFKIQNLRYWSMYANKCVAGFNQTCPNKTCDSSIGLFCNSSTCKCDQQRYYCVILEVIIN